MAYYFAYGSNMDVQRLETARLNPEGIYSTARRLGRLIRNDEEFVTALLEEKAVATVHGSAFGQPDNFRLSYATSIADVQRACIRIQEFCGDLR